MVQLNLPVPEFVPIRFEEELAYFGAGQVYIREALKLGSVNEDERRKLQRRLDGIIPGNLCDVAA